MRLDWVEEKRNDKLEHPNCNTCYTEVRLELNTGEVGHGEGSGALMAKLKKFVVLQTSCLPPFASQLERGSGSKRGVVIQLTMCRSADTIG